jgi:hypothetical protein
MKTPRKLTASEFEHLADAGLNRFIEQRMAEGTEPYRSEFPDALERIETLFAQTDNLRELDPAVFVDNPELIEAARHLGGPPLSQADLDTLSGDTVCNRKSISADAARGAVRAIKGFMDPFRFPWLNDSEEPAPHAVEAAMKWTASLWAVQVCKTSRRIDSSAEQEESVRQMLDAMGLIRSEDVRTIQALDDLPRNHYTTEVQLHGSKADLTVRLVDGRLCAIECKVSNSAVNSVKRLNRETVGKAEGWRTNYGRQVITVAVLAGVFKVSNLVDAQQSGVQIVFDHDLAPLQTFLAETTEAQSDSKE